MLQKVLQSNAIFYFLMKDLLKCSYKRHLFFNFLESNNGGMVHYCFEVAQQTIWHAM